MPSINVCDRCVLLLSGCQPFTLYKFISQLTLSQEIGKLWRLEVALPSLHLNGRGAHQSRLRHRVRHRVRHTGESMCLRSITCGARCEIDAVYSFIPKPNFPCLDLCSLWIAESFGQVQKLCRNKIIFIFISPKFEAFWHLDTSETLRNQSQRLWFIEFHLLLFTAAFVVLLLLWFHTLQALRRWPEKYELRF